VVLPLLLLLVDLLVPALEVMLLLEQLIVMMLPAQFVLLLLPITVVEHLHLPIVSLAPPDKFASQFQLIMSMLIAQKVSTALQDHLLELHALLERKLLLLVPLLPLHAFLSLPPLPVAKLTTMLPLAFMPLLDTF